MRAKLDAAFKLNLGDAFPGVIQAKLTAALLMGLLSRKDEQKRLLSDVLLGLRKAQTAKTYFSVKYAAVVTLVGPTQYTKKCFHFIAVF